MGSLEYFISTFNQLNLPLILILSFCIAIFVVIFNKIKKIILRKLDKAVMTVNLFGAYIIRKSRKSNDSREPSIVSIHLPNQNESLNKVGLDIGGSLIKLIYFVPNDQKNHKKGDNNNQEKQNKGGTLHFVKFEVNNIEQCISFLKKNNLHRHKTFRVTGGGAHKYADYFHKRLGVTFEKVDEMESLITGLNYFLKNIRGESFTYSHITNQPVVNDDVIEDPFPYLLVNIGSGVSILRVESENKYERVGGTSLGGGTFWGLCHLLTGETDFDSMLKLSEKGDARNVDLLVGDIYGQDYSKIGLSSTTIASSFGKLLSKKNTKLKYTKADIAMSLLRMISNNIGQIAYLHALKYNLERIYFGGFFLRNHRPTVSKISFAISFWSNEKIKAHFLHHEGYLGGFGALMLNPNNTSFYKKSLAYINKKLHRNDSS